MACAGVKYSGRLSTVQACAIHFPNGHLVSAFILPAPMFATSLQSHLQLHSQVAQGMQAHFKSNLNKAY